MGATEIGLASSEKCATSSVVMTKRHFVRTLAAAVCLLSAASGLWAQGLGFGRVHGADALNVRRGPGAGHPSVGVLRRGDRVEIEAVVGKWALVRNERFAGYVSTGFLIRPDGTAISQPTPTPQTSTAAPEAGTPALIEEEPTPITEVNAVDPVLREDISQILSLTKDVHREMQLRRDVPAQPALPNSPLGIQGGLGLLGLGGVIGFFVGSVLGRRQERSGRPRVRL